MSVIIVKISNCLKVEFIYDNNNEDKLVRLWFKFNKNNPNWLYLKITPSIAKKLLPVIAFISYL